MATAVRVYVSWMVRIHLHLRLGAQELFQQLQRQYAPLGSHNPAPHAGALHSFCELGKSTSSDLQSRPKQPFMFGSTR